MENFKALPHPNMVSNWKIKTQAKIGYFLMDLVHENPKSREIYKPGIVALSKKYHIGDKTFIKYLKKSIFSDENAKNNKKTLYLSENDIILIKEIIYLENRYNTLEIAQKNIIRCLIARL